MKVFKEITKDNGYPKSCSASDNNAEYILTSAQAHDLHKEYMEKYDRLPTSKWFRKNFQFTEVK